jgi:hypothetical protein
VIGVICSDHEKSVVREFFELFKTPWAFYEDGTSYDVVLASAPSSIAGVDAQLVMVFSSLAGPEDALLGLESRGRTADAVLESEGLRLPLYCGALALAGGASGRGTLAGTQPAVVECRSEGPLVLRCGYGLFSEVEFLLSSGQPIEHAQIPTLDLHIALVRRWIVDAGVRLVEIPPLPPGCDFLACLTHDVDFLGIRRHKLDHSIAGFLYRATVRSVIDVIQRRRSLRQLLRNWLAVLSLPLVYARILPDFWLPFDRYARMEGDLRSTFFLVPFRDRPGRSVTGSSAPRRAVRYGVGDARPWVRKLLALGYEVGVHGIDAWNDVNDAREELRAVAEVTGTPTHGVRMHWLYFDSGSFARLDRAGFVYDSTFGYNECVGFRAGTTQVFRPLSARRLLELPLHIQDVALFFPGRMHCREAEALTICSAIIDQTQELGGVLTLSWHERSLAPERQWDGAYRQLLEQLRRRRASIRPAGEIVSWFQARRAVNFEGVHVNGGMLRELAARPAIASQDEELLLRIHGVDSEAGARRDGSCFTDVPLRGGDLEGLLETSHYAPS